MKLIIFHYHFRPGGVRRVIELALPHLIRVLRPRIDGVILAGGELPDFHWREYLTKQLPRMSVELPIHPALGYASECDLPLSEIALQARKAIRGILQKAGVGNCIVWAHNLSLARNPLMAKAVYDETAALGIPLVTHHHDWWFDNRWQRWPELRQAGFRSLDAAARALLPTHSNVRHVAINQTDAAPLQHHLGHQAHWLPNLIETPPRPAASRIKKAKAWMDDKLGDNAPVWLLPCRLLRRKNVAEALLLTRWLRPEAWLVTTGSVSSDEEVQYVKALSKAAREHGWRLRLGILQGDESAMPTVPELLAASEAVMLTSIQEGFGLPFLEAAAAGRPLIARRLPNVSPDLAKFGFRLPQDYEDILVPPSLFDWTAEQRRQRDRFRDWLAALPGGCRKWAGKPVVISAGNRPRPVPLSRLTLTAQLEALSQPSAHSWKLCAPLNPFLTPWKQAAGKGLLLSTPWPATANRWLSGEAYARHFQKILNSKASMEQIPGASRAAQDEFIRERLASPNLFPLLWSGKP